MAAQYFKFKEPRTFLTSGGLGTMGLRPWRSNRSKDGLPGQNRGKYSRRRLFPYEHERDRHGSSLRQTSCPDHSEQSCSGMVRQWQTLFYEQRYSQTILNDGVDFVKVSEAMGAKAIRVTKMEEVEPALKMALHQRVR